MTEAELGYAAGILDGEGCISGTGSPDKRMVYVRVSVQQKHPEVVDWLYARFGGMKTERPDRENVLGFSGGYVWQLDNRQVFRFLELVLPHLVLKQRQAELALAFEATMPGQGNKKPDSVLLEQLLIVEQISILNRRSDGISDSGEV
jgi:hypothetical protein